MRNKYTPIKSTVLVQHSENTLVTEYAENRAYVYERNVVTSRHNLEIPFPDLTRDVLQNDGDHPSAS